MAVEPQREVDVVVVGAGLAGLVAALRLRAADREVAVAANVDWSSVGSCARIAGGVVAAYARHAGGRI